jgi:membrane protease subunit HflK
MRVVGDKPVSDVLTVGRTEAEAQSKVYLQELMDTYDYGVKIVAVQLQDVTPPESVKASFNEVNSAKQEQEKTINEAQKTYNANIPVASGNAKMIVAQAKAYAAEIVNKAEGDAQRFSDTVKEYKKNPQITEERLMLETMEDIYSKANIIFIDPATKGATLPVYNINEDVAAARNAKTTKPSGEQ